MQSRGSNVVVLCARIGRQLSEPALGRYLRLLPEDEREAVLRMRRWQDRQARLFGRLLIHRGLRLCGAAARLADLRYGEQGKPYLAGSEVEIGLTHSTDVVAAALCSGGMVGIDVEEAGKVERTVLNKVMDAGLIAQADGWRGPIDATTRLWTAFESIVKADGCGIVLGSKHVQLECDPQSPWPSGTLHGRRWHLAPLSPTDGSFGYVAAARPIKALHIHHLQFAPPRNPSRNTS